MRKDDMSDNLREYLSKIKDTKDDHCWFCNKTPDMIREEFYQYMEHPKEEFEDLELDDIATITYKTKRPVCAGCYFAIKRNASLIQEILNKSDDEIW